MGWNEKVLGGRVPDVCAPRQLRKRAGLIRSNGSWTHCSQQVHGQECWQGPVPPSREAAPFSLSPYQQDALLRGRISPPDWDAWRLWQSPGDCCTNRNRSNHALHSNEGCARRQGCRGIPACKDYVSWKQEGRIQPDGVNAKLYENHGRLEARPSSTLFLQPARVYKDRVEP